MAFVLNLQSGGFKKPLILLKPSILIYFYLRVFFCVYFLLKGYSKLVQVFFFSHMDSDLSLLIT